MGFFSSLVYNLRIYYWPWQSCPPLHFGCNGKLSIFLCLKVFLMVGFCIEISSWVGSHPFVFLYVQRLQSLQTTLTGRSPHLQVCCSLVMDNLEKHLRLPEPITLGEFGPKLGHLRLRVGPHVTVAAGSHPFMVATLARRASGHWLQRQNQREDLQGDLLQPCSAACPLGAAAQSHGLNWLLSTERQA